MFYTSWPTPCLSALPVCTPHSDYSCWLHLMLCGCTTHTASCGYLLGAAIPTLHQHPTPASTNQLLIHHLRLSKLSSQITTLHR